MKGLTQFIVDLRNSKDQEEETKRINTEISHIKDKFSTNNLHTYQKKKYICKLIYIYLQSNSDELDFGLKEAFELLESPKYPEKQLGYLSVSILISYNSSVFDSPHSFLNHLMQETYKHIMSDLKSNNEDFNCLALQFIAANFNINEFPSSNSSIVQAPAYDASNMEDWIELFEMVYSFTNSPMTGEATKKKACLALYALSKLYPDKMFLNASWIPRLNLLIDNKDLGVVLSSIPLIKHMVTIQPRNMMSVLPSIGTILVSLIVDQKCQQSYYYFTVPAPWLVVKLLHLVEYFFLVADPDNKDVPFLNVNDIDNQTLENLRKSVAISIQNGSKTEKSVPCRNSQSSILFQAVSLAVFLDASSDAISGAISALMTLLSSAETNTRYLALDALIKLTARSTQIHLIVDQEASGFSERLPVVYNLLYDKDISVRKKALDLLYTVCNPNIYATIVNKLLDLFPLADFSLKPELAIKIAVLAEKFATDSTWYVTTMLRLLSIGGGYNSNGVSYISNEVWERIVQIVVNNSDLQKKTCKLLVNLLRNPSDQMFSKSQAKAAPPPIGLSENIVKVAAFILGEFCELVADDEGCSPQSQFKLLYESYFQVSLITRAMLLSTFFKFCVKYRDEAFVADIVDLFEIESRSIDLEIQTRATEYFKLVTGKPKVDLLHALVKSIPPFVAQESPLMKRINSLSHVISANDQVKRFRSEGRKGSSSGNASEKSLEGDSLPLTSNWYSGYHRMLQYDAGIFFENQMVKITYRIVKDRFTYVIKFVVINNSAKTAGTEITGFKISNLQSGAKKENPSYLILLKQSPDTNIVEKSSMELEVKIRNPVNIDESTRITMIFNCGGSYNQLDLKIPVSSLKFISCTSLTAVDDFKKRWDQIGQILGSPEGESTLNVTLTHRLNSSNMVRLFSRLGFSVVHSTADDVQDGILVMGAGILLTAKGNYGVLIHLKSIDSIGKEFEVTVRCTGGGIACVLTQSVKEILEGKPAS